jgi:hypothetical protein
MTATGTKTSSQLSEGFSNDFMLVNRKFTQDPDPRREALL